MIIGFGISQAHVASKGSLASPCPTVPVKEVHLQQT
jgi:hypothetical protein